MEIVALKFGIKNNKSYHISDVESGLKCDCYCPACNEKLVAVKGDVRIHFFRHESRKDCKYLYETNLHYLAKEILTREKKLILPTKNLQIKSFQNLMKVANSLPDHKTIGYYNLKTDFKFYIIENVILEKKTHDIIPDILATIGGKQFIIEIAVTSFVKEQKWSKIEKMRIPVLEIDLSKLARDCPIEQLEKHVIENKLNRYWVYNTKEVAKLWYLKNYSAKIFEELIRFNESKLIRGYKYAPRVNNCPVKIGDPMFKVYVEKNATITDCEKCDFLNFINLDERYINCLGKGKKVIMNKIIEFDNELILANSKKGSHILPRFKEADYN